jgi:signal transduction histidine kinase
MRWTVQRTIRAGFLLLTIAPVVLGVLAYRTVQGARSAAADLARTNELVKELEQVLSRLKDVEVAQRDFILTGDPADVQALRESRRDIDAAVERLSGMRAEKRWLELLRTLVPQKFAEIDRTVESRQTGGIEAASQSVLTNRGAQAMDDIRRTVRNMILEENRLLAIRTSAADASFSRMLFLFGALILVTIALLWAVFYLQRRESAHSKQLNLDLERRVALRTEQLQRSNEDLQQFAYVASHDLKEPMRMISSYSTLLQRRYHGKLDEDADTYIGFIVDGVKRMNTLITDLLEYARAGELKDEQKVEVDVQEVLTNVLANLKVTIADAGAVVTSENLPKIVYEPLRLSQLLQNLIANAIKYRSPDRRAKIHVGCQNGENETTFLIKDNGMGIETAHQEQIFGIFKRLHGSEIEGTGIGLAMCKKIIERHGGRIWLESVPGVGSTFFFTVPK